MSGSDRTSPWVYIGVGCAVFVVLGVICAVVGGIWVFRGAKEFEQNFKDPVKRTEVALEILGAERLPEGYHAMAAFSAPLDLFEFAMLSSEAPDEEGKIGDFGERER